MMRKYDGPPRRYMLRQDDRGVIKDVTGKPIYFESKRQAKTYRDSTNDGVVVSPGPDHKSW